MDANEPNDVCPPCHRGDHDNCLDGPKAREDMENRSLRGDVPPMYGCECVTCDQFWSGAYI